MPIPNILGKMASMVLGHVTDQQIREAHSTGTRREGREGIHSLLLEFRAHLLNAVSNDIDAQPILQGFVQLDIPLKEKFISLSVTELLRQNCESVEGLKHIHSGLGTIIRYAKHLIKSNRQEQWGTISFKNVIVQRKILPLNGFSQVLSQLGYTEVTDCGQSFPPGTDPDKNAVVSLIADMELFRAELKIYCSGRHLHPESIGQYLPQNLRDELEERQASDLSMIESSDTLTPSVSMQEGQAHPTEIQAQDATKFTTASSAECNNNENFSPEGKMISSPHGNQASSSSNDQSEITSQFAENVEETRKSQALPMGEKEAVQSCQGETVAMNESGAIPDLVPSSISSSGVTGPDIACESPSDTSTSNKLACSVCGEEAVFLCRECYDNQMALCENCNRSWHKRQDRRHHKPQPISRHHRLSLESSGSGPSANFRFDEHYGIMAATKQSRSKEEQTSVMNASKFGQPSQPTPDKSTVLDRELGFPPNNQTTGFQEQPHVQYDPIGSHSQNHHQPPSRQRLFLPQGPLHQPQQVQQHQQQLHQGYNHYQPLQHQMSSAYRFSGQSPMYNPSVTPAIFTPATPRFSQPQGMSMIMSSPTNSNTNPVGMPQQLQGLNAVAGQMYHTPSMPGMSTTGSQLTYPYMAMAGDGQVGIQHQLQHQQRLPLPPYVKAQLDQTTHLQHILGPRWYTPVGTTSRYHSPASHHYKLREQQIGPRLTYPHNGNTVDTRQSIYGTPPANLQYGGPHLHQSSPYSLQQPQGPSQQPQSALLQSMLLQNHQALPYPESVDPGLLASHMDMSLQQTTAPNFVVAAGTFPGLNRPNNDKKFDHSNQVFLKLGSSNSQRGQGLGALNANINAQESYQQMTPLRYPYPGASDSAVSPCQSPFISAPSSPLSTPPPSSPTSNSEYIKKLSTEQDLTKRINMCDHFIRNISADMAALHNEMLKRMEREESYFHTTSECLEMHRRMEEMVKERSRLQSYKEKLKSQVSQFYRRMGHMEQEIYYPPDVNESEPSKAVPSKTVTDYDDSLGMNIMVQDKQKLLNVIVDNSQDSLPETPPALPPRSSKPTPHSSKPTGSKSFLDMTIPAPNVPRSPSPSTRMWVCQHCTFFNPVNVHICQVCHRTSDHPEIVTGSGEPCGEDDTNGGEILKTGVEEEEEEEEEKSAVEDLEKDKFIATLAELANELKPKKPNLFEEDEDDDIELWENEDPEDNTDNTERETRVGQLIIGSQKQVMEEKIRAKKEFELREQQQMRQQALSSTNSDSKHLSSSEDLKLTTLNTVYAGTSSTSTSTSSGHPPFGVGARPKHSKQVAVNAAYTHVKDNSNWDSCSTENSPQKGEKQKLRMDQLSSISKHQSDSIEDSLARMEELKSIDSLQASGAQLTQLIKMADLENFDIQAVQIALEICESMKDKPEPLAWLRANWRKNVTKIAAQAGRLGQSHSPNSVGEVSFEEAEVAYINCQGNMKEAAEKCVQDRQALYEKLSTLAEDFPREEILEAMLYCKGDAKAAQTRLYEKLSTQAEDFPREEILEAMLYCKGDAKAAQTRLVKAKLEPFANRIWQQSTEVKGTSGGLSVSTAPSPLTATAMIAGIMAGAGALAVPRLPTGAQANLGVVNMAGVNPGTVDPYQVFATSVIGHQQFQDMMRDKSMNIERRVRMIYVEGRLHSWGRADMVIKILDQEVELQQDLDEGHVTLEDIVEAVRDCQDRTSALAYLRQECQICFGRFPMNKIHNLNICQCRLCQECLVSHFEIAIRERHVRHWVCPQCSQPDLSDLEVASNYLQFLGMQLQPMISQDLRDLFETKFRDWHLQKMDYFRWCAHCAEGFLAENQGGLLMMTCPRCGKKTCFKCKKQWEDQHEGLTCEEFSQWKVDNDPSNQSVGLAKHLDENGIDCPNCKMRFALAKGGCMHFKCPQCGHEFCSGCNEAYHHKNMCTKYKLCKNLGLHCHCPRDCFSFLRDYTVDQLQTLLKQHNVQFNTAPPADQQDRAHCPVMEQKEFDEGNRDEKCGRDALPGGAGLCEEIVDAIKQLNQGKAAGPDLIPPEALKADVDTTATFLCPLFAKVWTSGKYPIDWKEGHLVKIPKKGDLSRCENYRGITLLSIPGKVFNRVLLNRIKAATDPKLHDEQAGYRSNRSTTDHIATLKIIVEQSLEWNSPLIVNFLDYEKAFDSIDREFLWKIMRNYGIPQKIVSLVRKMYDGTCCRIVHDGQLTGLTTGQE
ncbi:E3 ubiquitin-protein ligase RNF31 [Elysia marginata]|uniref:E3 ubiquitin-protein ligase RNF31 n=1 Tax=Elysia marginata TaxID=1093978 RepID=A0AAV4F883_9GAST|nr:E3 ubiquitin-protein ligase RNF31 [Elysia marginata]